MAQLVGSSCTRCGNRISSVLDGRFCEKCQNPVHDACRPPAGSTEAGCCMVCGTDLIAAEKTRAAALQQEAARIRALPPPPPLETGQMLYAYRAGRWFLGAFVALGIGVVLLAGGEIGPGIGATIAGCGMAVLGVLIYRR